jgi:hypothetical protein
MDKGITVCDRWLNFWNFVEDMQATYSAKLTLDRIDNTKGYFPENCRWVPATDQMKNRTDNLNLTFNGETRCIADWAKITGISDATIRLRVKRRGWSAEKALTTPARVINQPKERYIKKQS